MQRASPNTKVAFTARKIPQQPHLFRTHPTHSPNPPSAYKKIRCRFSHLVLYAPAKNRESLPWAGEVNSHNLEAFGPPWLGKFPSKQMDHTHLLPHHLPTRTTTHLRSSLFTGLNFSYNLFNPVFSDRGLRPLLLLVGGVMWSRHTCNEIQGQRLTDGKGGVYRIASSAIFS